MQALKDQLSLHIVCNLTGRSLNFWHTQTKYVDEGSYQNLGLQAFSLLS